MVSGWIATSAGAGLEHGVLRRADQRRAERQHVGADIGLAFGKQQHAPLPAAMRWPFRAWCAGASPRRLRSTKMVRCSEAMKPTKNQSPHLLLGDESDVGDRADGDDVGP